MQSEDYRRLTPKLALELAAPHTWAASVCPALFGDFYCWQQGLGLTKIQGVMLLLACILLQSAVNTLNDYFDFVKGTDTAEDNVAETDAVLIYGHINPKSALILGLCYIAAGAAAGLAACIGHGLVPYIIGIIGVAVIVIYSGGPLPVSYLPIGEFVSGFVMGGLIPLGIAACADAQLHWEILYYSIPLIIGIGLIMMSNNGCDIEKDRKSGRHTLPTYLGRKRTLAFYRAFLITWIALASVLPAGLLGPVGFVSALLVFITGRKKIGTLLALELKPEGRIEQMTSIASVNLIIKLSYTAAFAAGFILEVIHG